jgi:thiol-disulfide isomerase/thioredoxin
LLVNFWATWCEPCREEFPDLVRIDAEYRSRGLDFITISLDDLAEIKRDVPQFLGEMKAAMPAYLLKTPNEEAAIAYVAPDWRGGLPFTVLFDAEGKRVYTRMGLVKTDILRAQLEKVVQPKPQ